MTHTSRCEVLSYLGDEMWEEIGDMSGGVRNDLIYWGLLVLSPWWPDQSDHDNLLE